MSAPGLESAAAAWRALPAGLRDATIKSFERTIRLRAAERRRPWGWVALYRAKCVLRLVQAAEQGGAS